MAKRDSVFKTEKKIRLGIWGLGRGRSFYKTCQLLNFEVVAGCDFNAHMRDRFHEEFPDALVTDDAERFLAADFDAVLLATFCPNHADDAIACLEAGKHVLSEVTAFHTMAEGVRLVETVERTGLVYNLAENYPFSSTHMWLAKKWREGLFGDLMYAEFEYVHECRILAYTYIDGVPVQPGHQLHNWRSWLNFHYYNTHSLGPVMYITDTRPTRVVSLLGQQKLAGYPIKPPEGMGGIAPSLVNLDNGAVMRNLMGSTTNDCHRNRLWGTLGSADFGEGPLRLRLGASGISPKLEVEPRWEDLGELAAKTGHGGGDFWVLYFFARQILYHEPAPFDVYAAADCTIPGLLAYRSSRENGKPYDVPDFRDKKSRGKYRNDHYACPRVDVEKGPFPRNADSKIVGRFTTVMSRLIHHACTVRGYLDWMSVIDSVTQPERVAEIADRVVDGYDELVQIMREARRMADAYPRSEGARLLNDMLAIGCEDVVLRRGFLAEVKQERTRLKRKART